MKKNPKLGFMFAVYEHIFEGITNIFLIASVVLVYLSIQNQNLIKFAFAIVVLTAIIHLIARLCHKIERKCFRGK